MKTATMYMVRHGETEWNLTDRLQGREDSPLTQLGEAQALRVRQSLTDKNIGVAYTSPSLRAHDTAKIVTGNWPVDLYVNDDLAGMNLGEWQGKPLAEIKQTFPVDYDNFFNCPEKFSLEGAESYAALQNRVVDIIRDIFKKHNKQNILVVTHAIVIKVLIAYLNTGSIAGLENLGMLKNGTYVTLDFQE